MSFTLTNENYHSLEANQTYMSRSLYDKFCDCEAATMAYLSGKWSEEASTALLIGQYVHAWSEGTLADFMAEHPECFKKDGTLKADYELANRMIETLRNDEFAMYVLEGRKEVILTAEFAGTQWKVMLDVYDPEHRRIVDLKTTRSITEHAWNAELKTKLSFIENYNYLTQAALYCEIERLASGREDGDWLSFFLAVVSKEKYPDKEIIDMRDPLRYAQELAAIKERMPRILAVKNGEIEPLRCDYCDYCRATKKLVGAVHWSKI